jgi:hypothetical protein
MGAQGHQNSLFSFLFLSLVELEYKYEHSQHSFNLHNQTAIKVVDELSMLFVIYLAKQLYGNFIWLFLGTLNSLGSANVFIFTITLVSTQGKPFSDSLRCFFIWTQ